jgi:hypothetical protein
MEVTCTPRVMPRIHQRFRPSSEKCPAVILLSHSRTGRFRPVRHVPCAFSFHSRCARIPDGRRAAASTRAQRRSDRGVGARSRQRHGRADRARSAASRKLGQQLEARVKRESERMGKKCLHRRCESKIRGGPFVWRCSRPLSISWPILLRVGQSGPLHCRSLRPERGSRLAVSSLSW